MVTFKVVLGSFTSAWVRVTEQPAALVMWLDGPVHEEAVSSRLLEGDCVLWWADFCGVTEL